MRNQFAGNCYRCGLRVEAGTGYFEKRHDGLGWRVQHCYRTHNDGVTCEMAKAAAAKKQPVTEDRSTGRGK